MSLNNLNITTSINIIKAHKSINNLTCINFNKVALTSQNTVGIKNTKKWYMPQFMFSQVMDSNPHQLDQLNLCKISLRVASLTNLTSILLKLSFTVNSRVSIATFTRKIS